ncbi:MAG: class I SAM-dependent methyltransferase [Hyphomicrobiaceae bacterium]
MVEDSALLMTERPHDVREEYEQIYQQPDPRAYFRILHGLDYRIPELAAPVFRNVVNAISEFRGCRPKVLDLGCGFGINAALMRYPIDMDRLAHRCRDLDTGEISSASVIEFDRNYFASWPPQVDLEYIGYDVSELPVSYAKSVRLIDYGFSRDLELEELTAAEKKLVRGTDLILSTGCAGYVTEATFEHFFAVNKKRKPWLAIFVLRTESFADLSAYFEAQGMKVEKLEGVTFIQRRFHSSTEWTQALMTLETHEVPTEGKEADGLLHAEFFLIRPEAESEAHPLETFVSVSSGTEGTFGGWRGRPWGA